MRCLVPLLFVALVSGCAKPDITELDKKNLLNTGDLVAIGCKASSKSDLSYESGGVKYLTKKVTAVFSGNDSCRFYVHMEMTEYRIAEMARDSVSSALTGASLGLKFTDIETRKPEKPYKEINGDYLELYNKDKNYTGFVYASREGAKYLLVMAMGVARDRQPSLFTMIKKIEGRNFDQKMSKPGGKSA